MNIIFGARRTGRTTQIIRRAHEKNAYILVSTRARALAITDQAKKLGIDILFPITMFEFLRARNTGFVKDLLIDDADEFLELLSYKQGWTLDTISICKSDGKWAELFTPEEFDSICGETKKE